LYPQPRLRPRARSNFLPLDRTYGFVWLRGTPGAGPKCLHASLDFRLPCMRIVFLPVGAFKASWSKVIISPPAFRIRARAFSVTRSAHTVNLGNFQMRGSSTTVPTTTAMRPSRPCNDISLASLDVDMGGRLIRVINNRLRTTLLNFELVLRTKYRYSLTRSSLYTSLEMG